MESEERHVRCVICKYILGSGGHVGQGVDVVEWWTCGAGSRRGGVMDMWGREWTWWSGGHVGQGVDVVEWWTCGAGSRRGGVVDMWGRK